MSRVFDKPITIQILDEQTETWSDKWQLHAFVNKTQGREYSDAGAERSVQSLTFEVRYFSDIKAIRYNTQLYRIKYDDHFFNIEDYDDFMESHQTIKLTGENYV